MSNASAQVKVGLLVSTTGPAAAIGISQKNTGAMLPRTVGAIPLEYIQLDDGGDPTQASQNARRLIEDEHVDALIGPSTTANALAILDIVAENKVPLLATVGTSSVVEPIDAKRRWVFKTTQNDSLIAAALIEHMVKHGVHTVGFIAFDDAVRCEWREVFTPMAAASGIRVVANERYTRADPRVTSQVMTLMAAKPDAILIAAVEGFAILPQATLRDRHYRGQIYQTQAVATRDFIRRGGGKVEGTVLAAGSMVVIDYIADGDPIKEMAAAYIDDYRHRFNERPDSRGANTFDAFILLARALPKAWQTDLPGTPGRFPRRPA